MNRTLILHLCFLLSSAVIAFLAFWIDHETKSIGQIFTGGNLVAFLMFTIVFFSFHWLAYGIQAWLFPSIAAKGIALQYARTIPLAMLMVVLLFIAL